MNLDDIDRPDPEGFWASLAAITFLAALLCLAALAGGY